MTPREIVAMATRATPEGNGWFAELGLALRELEAPRARSSFRRSLRRSLITASVEAKIAKPRTEPFSFLKRPMLPRYVLAAGLVVSLVATAGGSAAAWTVPAEAAGALKRAFENAELALTFGELERVAVLERHVERRLSELAHAVVVEPTARPTATAAYEEAVLRFRAAVAALVSADRDGKHEAALEVAEAAAAKHHAVVEALRERSANAAHDKSRKESDELHKQALLDRKERAKEKTGRDEMAGKASDRRPETPGGQRDNRPSRDSEDD
jgi:hypothetical protein